MNKKIIIAAAGLLLGGCVTTPKEIPPLELSTNRGAMALDFTIDLQAGKNYYILTAAEYDPETRRVIMDGGQPKNLVSFRNGLSPNSSEHKLWAAQLAPGFYTFTKIEAKLNTGLGDGNIPYGTDPLLLLIVGVTAIAISEATVDVLPFTDDAGNLLDDAPTFEISEGRVSYLGELTATVDTRTKEVPEYDKDGYWDGEKMKTETEKRYMADYRYDPDNITEHWERLNLSTYPLLPQPLEIFSDRRFMLEDYPDTEGSPRSQPREIGFSSVIDLTPPAAPILVSATTAPATGGSLVKASTDADAKIE
tara:strand:- start:236 stop:1156 length:921 start_codon:yes stop_codon:yes gene_type:complete